VLDPKANVTASLGRSDWTDWSRSGELLFARDGRLYRLVQRNGDFLQPEELIDLRQLRFQPPSMPREAVVWSGRSPRYSGDTLVEKVPRLAICSNLGKDIGPLLLHCDEEWNVLGVSGAGTIDDVKMRAEKNYPGVGSRWIAANVAVEEALKYYDEATEGLKCLFCGKRPFDVSGMVGSPAKAICRECVEEFYRVFQEPDVEGEST